MAVLPSCLIWEVFAKKLVWPNLCNSFITISIFQRRPCYLVPWIVANTFQSSTNLVETIYLLGLNTVSNSPRNTASKLGQKLSSFYFITGDKSYDITVTIPIEYSKVPISRSGCSRLLGFEKR